MTDATPTIDFDRLFKLRLVVARHGEMDAAKWWNTQGMLGPSRRCGAEARFPGYAPLRPGSDRLRGRQEPLP